MSLARNNEYDILVSMKALIFDLDDTLYDQILPFKRALLHHLKVTDTELRTIYLAFRHYADKTFNEMERGERTLADSHLYRLKQALIDSGYYLTDKEVESIQQEYERLQGQLDLDPILPTIFQLCKDKGIQLGIITNGPYDHQLRKIESLGLTKWIDPQCIVISGQVGVAKPAKAIFHMMQARMNVEASQLVYIGDSYENDVIGSKSVGWYSVWFNHRKRFPIDQTYQPDMVIEDWDSFLPKLEQFLFD